MRLQVANFSIVFLTLFLTKLSVASACDEVASSQLAAPNESPTWTLVSTRPSLKVYSREVSGSPIREILARAIADESIEQLRAAIVDLESYTQFMPNVAAASVLKSNSDTNWLFQQFDFPFGATDRFTIIEITEEAEGTSGIRIKWTRADETEFNHPGQGIVLLVNEGHWLLRPICDNEKTDVTYYVRTDPGGLLWASIVNHANETIVPDVILSVRGWAALK